MVTIRKPYAARKFYLHVSDEEGRVLAAWRVCKRHPEGIQQFSPSPVLLLLDEVSVGDNGVILFEDASPPQSLSDFTLALTREISLALSVSRERIVVRHARPAPPIPLSLISRALKVLGEDRAADWRKVKNQVNQFSKAPLSPAHADEDFLCLDMQQLETYSHLQSRISRAVEVSLTFLPDLRQVDRRNASMLASLLGRLVHSIRCDETRGLPAVLRLVSRMEVMATHQQERGHVFLRGLELEHGAAKTIQTVWRNHARRRGEGRSSGMNLQDEKGLGEEVQEANIPRSRKHVAAQEEEVEECEDASASSSSTHGSPIAVRTRSRPLLVQQESDSASIADSADTETSERSETTRTRRKHLPAATTEGTEASDAESVALSSEEEDTA
eukprot:767091-Hanusia_phi.AAC.1